MASLRLGVSARFVGYKYFAHRWESGHSSLVHDDSAEFFEKKLPQSYVFSLPFPPQKLKSYVECSDFRSLRMSWHGNLAAREHMLASSPESNGKTVENI
jgi:hypothetical protein